MSDQHYTFFSDPGHGWLEVALDELRRLGITKDISCGSYRRGKMVYLEEDGDLDRFVRAKQALGESFNMIDVYHDDESPVRGYQYYYPD